MDQKWIKRFCELAQHVATWSKDPSTQIGAVITKDTQVLSLGYNGFPRGLKDDPELLANREFKYERTVHAEMNAIYNATANGVSLKGSILFVSGLPVCHKCALGVVQVGIREIHMVLPDLVINERWQDSWDMSNEIFKEAGIGTHFHCYKHGEEI